MIKFPNDFYFGSATSAPQCEDKPKSSKKGDDIWDYLYSISPNRFFDEVGPETTSSFYSNYKEDIEYLVETGHNSFRTSISWSRLFPKGYGEINEDAVNYYRDLFESLIENKIEPFVNLYHFDMPMELQKIGGFENRKVVDYYRLYAKKCFELYGDIVKKWFTFNEPIVPVEAGYLETYHYPCKVNPKAAVQVAYHTSLANALAIKEYKNLNLHGKIGIVLNLTPAYPRSDNPSDIKAATIAELFQSKSFLTPAVKGFYDKELIEIIHKHNLTPEYNNEDLEIIKNHTVDFLGVNYYQPLRVAARDSMPNPDSPFLPTYYFDYYNMPGKKMNPYRGWEIYYKGIYDIAINLRDNYGNIQWLVSENGMGVENEERFIKDGIIQDDYRIEFYKGHLKELHKAIEEGCNCIGYHVWTFIDCWSWLNAYKNRYGLVQLDLDTGKRTIKKSGYWFKSLSEEKGFD